ncbi:hypothetical protein PENSUB_2348, partial [Penicillium subrubescens]
STSSRSQQPNPLQASPDIPELDDSRQPRYLTLTPQTTFLHKGVTSIGSLTNIPYVNCIISLIGIATNTHRSTPDAGIFQRFFPSRNEIVLW